MITPNSASATTYIWCPACDYAVRELDDTPCPHCRCCPFCGRRLKSEEVRCNCSIRDDFDFVERLQTEVGIPESQVAREKHRATIRQQLQTKKGIAAGIIAGLLMIIGKISRETFGLWTVYNAITMAAVGCGLIFLCSNLFRVLDQRRLNAEFPEAE